MNFRHSQKLFLHSSRYLRPLIRFGNSTPSVLQHNGSRYISQSLKYYNNEKIGVASADKIVQLTDYMEQHHSVIVKKVNNVLQDDNLPILSQQQKNLLFQCCGKLLSNKPLDLRRRLCNEVLDKIKSLNQLTIEDYNCFIQICTENEVEIDFKNFLPTMVCEANEETYKLLLENVCERGNTEKAFEILTLIKQLNYSADERVFNAFILGNGILNGLQGGENVITTMKAAKISESSRTYWSLLKALASHRKKQDFLMILNNPKLKFDDMQFLDLLLRLGLHDNHEWLQEVKRKFFIDTIPRNLTHLFDHLCINLIHRGKAKNAIEMHCSLTDDNVDSKFLLEEVAGTDISPEDGLEIAYYLNAHKKKKTAFMDMTEFALRSGKTDISWRLLETFTVLRPHYFWPLLVKAAKENGELGIINALKRMLSMQVKVDADTLESYVLPYCDISNLNSVIIRLKNLNVTVKQLLTPIIVVALRANRIKDVQHLCEDYNYSLDGSRMTKSLAHAWKNTKDNSSVVLILKRMCEGNESENDLTGVLLLHMLRLSKTNEDYTDYLQLLKILKKEKLVMKPVSAEIIQRVLQTRGTCKLHTAIEDALDGLLDMSLMNDNTPMVHPRNMTTDELECHLVELQSKKLETRGVLRRLIQEHVRQGNDAKVSYYVDLLNKSGYKMSPGILASLLVVYIRQDDLHSAMDTYKKLKIEHETFLIDQFKIVDLAMLMLKNGQYEEAVTFLKKEGYNQSISPERIQKNIWRLLNEAKNPAQALELFECLQSIGYCKPTNVILGPVLRSFLKCDDLDGAVKYYTQCAKEYKCTPLQLEMVALTIKSQCEEKLSQIVEATSLVHGVKNAHLSLAAALAEQGLVKPLNKLLSEVKSFSDVELKRRCDWWIQDKKLLPLQTLAEASDRLPKKTLNIDIVYMSILQIYVNNNDCEGALDFFKELNGRDIFSIRHLAKEIQNLLKRNKHTVPDNLLSCIN